MKHQRETGAGIKMSVVKHSGVSPEVRVPGEERTYSLARTCPNYEIDPLKENGSGKAFSGGDHKCYPSRSITRPLRKTRE